MNTLVIVLIAAVVLFGAYVFYGRWLANKWGIDPKAKTPAVEFNDGKDFVPTNGWTVFSHQFSSIAGAGPVTGAIQAAAFGWLPVLLWVLIGGIFFGAVWANESWGRYWGWDPKETWALITMVIYAIVTHLRLIPKCNNLWLFNFTSILAFYSVLMTFFGVNYFLSGMHSYGQNDNVNGIFIYLYLSIILVLGAGFISYRKRTNFNNIIV